ncbi:MAG: tryptophan 7-halogenase [Prochloron sp. SP5CPC1]|nr:tryptophan 7-halogenase [Candidatus Paraprochloron terpiosi SP5CPC1]
MSLFFPYGGEVRYGYYLDAGLLATYLREKAIARGVHHIVDDVVDVILDPQGNISQLKTEKSGNISGELFIDCSGFRGLLINQALQEPFDSYSDSLFCDRAIAIPLSTSSEKEEINPYTTATALDSGWTWHTPLYNRSGNGYVYSSSFITPEAAEQEFRNHLGAAAEGVEARHIPIRVGKTRNAWVKNCVSIGLSSGFIEPLESIGIFLIEQGIQALVDNFPDKSFNPIVRKRYNKFITYHYENIRDFIVLHYCTTQREDTPFWKANKYHPAIPENLQENLELFKAMLPNFDLLERPPLFGDYSYACILLEMKYLPETSLPRLDYLEQEEIEKELDLIQNQAIKLKQNLPNHSQYLQDLHGANLTNSK